MKQNQFGSNPIIRNSRRGIIIAVVCAALVFVSLFCILMYFKDKKENNAETADTSVQQSSQAEAFSEQSTDTKTDDTAAAEEAETVVNTEDKTVNSQHTGGKIVSRNDLNLNSSQETPAPQTSLESVSTEAVTDVPEVPAGEHYACHYSEISRTMLFDVCSKTESYIFKRPEKDPCVQINEVRYIGDIFMGRKASCMNNNEDDNISNKLYNLFKVDMTYTREENGTTYQTQFTSVYYRRYINVFVKTDGSCSVDLQNSTEPSNFKMDIKNVNGTDSIQVVILGKKEIEDVKDFLYNMNRDNYYIEYYPA